MYITAAARFMKEAAKQKLKDLSIQPLLPVLYDFPFVWTTPYIDISELFIVETMQVFHVSVSRMLKEAAFVRLRSTTEKTDCYRSVQRSERTFESLSMESIRQVNNFVE